MPVFLVVLAVLLALNVRTTRLVLAAPEEWFLPKRMLIMGIWLLPFIGVLLAESQLPSRATAPGPPTGQTDRPEAPILLSAAGAAGFDVQDHLTFANGFPVLEWRAVSEWAQRCATPEAAALATDQGRQAWLLHLRDALGPEVYLQVTDDAYVLSTLELKVAQAMASYVSTARQRISQVLGDLARFPSGQRSILVVLDSEEDYYHYVSIYYPSEGEFAFSGGMYIDAGCPHFVVVRGDLSSVEPVIAHELTHSALAHLRLPKWLDEGLAVNTERKVAGEKPRLHTPHELHRLHRGFWNAERIQQFWSGASFDRTDHGNLLSYELARIIVEQMAKQWDGFARFVASALPEDAGAEAARASLSIALGSYAATLLEAQDSEAWEPDPTTWSA
jgi:hypothetical protein